jgi:aminopeptidase N
MAGLALAAVSAFAAIPFRFDKADGRLPKNVVPLDYTLVLLPHIDERTLEGDETVVLEFREATQRIEFNSNDQEIRKLRVDGELASSVETSAQAQLTKVELARPLPAGRHTLHFTFQGRIDTNPPGIWIQKYSSPERAPGVLLTTKFEPTYARSMFPCWDEPSFRATFQLSVTIPARWEAVSNMPVQERTEEKGTHGSSATVRFRRSPRMPSYLVELTAGEMRRIDEQAGGTNVGVWTVAGQERNARDSLAHATRILADYNEYFGTPYPLPKLDLLAIPGGFTGAMENWGAITFNDRLLLLSPSSTLRDRQTAFSVLAHEMAHQWNGDLVTMAWWDDLWLNESFASWRAAAETDLRNPTWNWALWQDATKESAMDADARQASHGIEHHVTNELQAQSAFDPQITYGKGQSVLRMLEAYLGPEDFRSGIRAFLKDHAYSNATSVDLWQSLSDASGKDVGTIAARWTQQPGFPLVSVRARCDAQGARTVELSQQRFLLQGADAAALRWSVPLRMRSGNGPVETFLLDQDEASHGAGRCNEPLTINAGASGFFRALYDDATLRINENAFDRMAATDRIVLLDDQWALVRAGRQDLARYLALVDGMGDDLNERAWTQVAQALGTIEYDERGMPGHEAFVAYARSILGKLAARLGWDERSDESPGLQDLRRTVLLDLGVWGDVDVIAQARARFAAFASDRGRIKPDDQDLVLSIVGRNADARQFAQLHEIARSAHGESELRRYYGALMQVMDPGLADEAARIALSDEIPAQSASARLGFILALQDRHPQLSWSTLTANLDPLLNPLQPYRNMVVAQDIPAFFWNSRPLDELEAWVRAQVPADLDPQIARSLERARFLYAEKTALAHAADAYLAGAAVRGS